MTKIAWVGAIDRASKEDRWCEQCGAPLWYLEDEDREFCMLCWAVQDAIEIVKQEFDLKLYQTIQNLNEMKSIKGKNQ